MFHESRTSLLKLVWERNFPCNWEINVIFGLFLNFCVAFPLCTSFTHVPHLVCNYFACYYRFLCLRIWMRGCLMPFVSD